MGTGASANENLKEEITDASTEDLKKAMASFSDEERAKIAEAAMAGLSGEDRTRILEKASGASDHVLRNGWYKLFSVRRDGVLFCGDGTEGGDHWAWVAPSAGYENSGKERWYVERQADGTYKFFNDKWKGPLFCGDGTDGCGDHWAWVEPRPEYENNGKERWHVEKQGDGTYKIFSAKWKGPLFCGDGTDFCGDHWAWVAPGVGYENSGKERWRIEEIPGNDSDDFLEDGVYKLFSSKWSGPLFCGDSTDGGDHWAWVAPSATTNCENSGKERWHVKRQADGTYKLFNEKWTGILYCGDGTDGCGDHWAWVTPDLAYENNGKERWHVKKQGDGTYKIFNGKWKGPLFCGDGTDGCGDHWAWVAPGVGYESSGKERWMIEKIPGAIALEGWMGCECNPSMGYNAECNNVECNNVDDGLQDGCYKLFSVRRDGVLFCGDGTDGGGDHWAWVAPSAEYENSGKERWHLERQGDGTYKFFNEKWVGPLFCGDGKDGCGDHWAWVEPRRDYENGGKERWHVEKQADGTYKIFNAKWKGPLFCGDGTDGCGDHWAWVTPSIEYENAGKERWRIERV